MHREKEARRKKAMEEEEMSEEEMEFLYMVGKQLVELEAKEFLSLDTSDVPPCNLSIEEILSKRPKR